MVGRGVEEGVMSSVYDISFDSEELYFIINCSLFSKLMIEVLSVGGELS